MKTFLAVIIAVVVTWTINSVVHGVRTGTDRLWIVSAVKAPGRMALAGIQADMAAHRYSLARPKVDAFVTAWQRFEAGPDSCRGQGIGDIMVTLSKTPNGEPGGAANVSRPIRSGINSTSSAAGSCR